MPRIRMRAPVPTVPSDGMTETPEARPCSNSWKLVTGATSVSMAVSILATALPISRRRCSPVAVTTISSIDSATRPRTKSRTAVPPASTVTAWVTEAYPSSTTVMS